MLDDRRGSQPLNPWQAWLSMFGIRAPLSGDVTQDVAPSIGLVNINATRSGDPQLEQREADVHALDQLHDLAERIAAVKEEAALDRIDRIVADVHTLSRDPQANADAIQRVREALPER